MKTLALIPARSGSKSVPCKNIKLVGDKPLIAHTIEVAKQSILIDRVIISTDCLEIASISRMFGAETPFIRPPELAKDDTSSIEVVIHTLDWLEQQEGYIPDYVMLLQPTSPLRIKEDIESSLRLARKFSADAVVSVCPIKQHPYWAKSISHDGQLTEFLSLEENTNYSCRQNLPPAYVPNGAIYIATPEVLFNKKTFYTNQTYAYVMPPERSIDIDTLWDFYLTDLILKNKDTVISPKNFPTYSC